MAKKKAVRKTTTHTEATPASPQDSARQQAPAEERYAEEFTFLRAIDTAPRPAGWLLSPERVVDFLCGTNGESIRAPSSSKLPAGLPKSMKLEPKFVGPRSLVERCVVTLAGERGLLLVGQPGTAKSMLGELLSAAISGTSALTIQGTAGASEDHFKYGWNYAMLLDKGPRPEALVPSPVFTGMRQGALVRIEEITRCLPEVQDSLISILSERRLMIPELSGEEGSLFAAPGFNLIATANLRDRGVSEMSAALKRRFNFETVLPIADPEQEVQLVGTRARAVLHDSGLTGDVDQRLLEILVTTFRDLRDGQTAEGWSVERPAAVMSTAEAVTVAAAITRQGAFFSAQKDPVSLVPGYLLGVVFKDNVDDRDRLLAYWDGPVRRRGERDPLWKRMYELRDVLEDAELEM
ncbi:AAA domain (dynein-related subfamily) [Gimesia panareensis]|uniref:AAA domain (Dynein-related subfamily) n=1 Tax=Gimesia panareensis TaxID=2527978 RepID=A0A518FLN9_9PLAN|nr:AAA family ATPase [Gimesia panareensis]QDV17240.1 AAA domain (dynein-related subfamily) [Gimesia panareensis]